MHDDWRKDIPSLKGNSEFLVGDPIRRESWHLKFSVVYRWSFPEVVLNALVLRLLRRGKGHRESESLRRFVIGEFERDRSSCMIPAVDQLRRWRSSFVEEKARLRIPKLSDCCALRIPSPIVLSLSQLQPCKETALKAGPQNFMHSSD